MDTQLLQQIDDELKTLQWDWTGILPSDGEAWLRARWEARDRLYKLLAKEE